jgi:hypothetical protein
VAVDTSAGRFVLTFRLRPRPSSDKVQTFFDV